jgi:hypothetical protein
LDHTPATVASAYVVVSQQTKIYKSSTLIRVQQRITDPTQAGSAIGVAQHLAQTYAQIAVTGSIGDRVYRLLNGRVPRSEVRLSAQPVQDLELLYISAESSDPRSAAAVANAAPTALRAFIDAQAGGMKRWPSMSAWPPIRKSRSTGCRRICSRAARTAKSWGRAGGAPGSRRQSPTSVATGWPGAGCWTDRRSRS